ncbi:MAG: flagellar export chaperone FliS [Desulfuromonas sp.]|nr:flagellar export chaperone FliS [Desulfuromonas sp.]
MNTYTQQYQQNQILTASPERILIMLYDGAIRFTRQAIMGIESGNRVQKLEGISRAMAIISEFANTLDHGIGGEIAANLDGLYAFMNNELSKANLKNDVSKLKVVEKLLVNLRGTWTEAIDIAAQEKVAQDNEAVSVAPSAPERAAAPAPAVPASYGAPAQLPPNYKPLSAAG